MWHWVLLLVFGTLVETKLDRVYWDLYPLPFVVGHNYLADGDRQKHVPVQSKLLREFLALVPLRIGTSAPQATDKQG